jgi:hypothetical protein
MIQNYMMLPFYEAKEKQFRFRANCDDDSPLHSFRIPNYMLPSFFFKREKRPLDIGFFRVYDLNDTLVAQLSALRHIHSVSAPLFDGFGYVPNRLESILDTFATPEAPDPGYSNYLLPCGKYYIELSESDDVKKYYSEIFEVVDDEAITDGDELILNGRGQTTMDNWLTGGSWAPSGSTMNYGGGTTGVILSQVISNANDDDNHFYKVSFNIGGWNNFGDPTRYVRVFLNGAGDYVNSILVDGSGTPYTYYVKNVSQIVFQVFNGNVTFVLGSVSVKRIDGHVNHVSMMTSRSCKFPNSIAVATYNYFNYYLLDALIAAPEYGEVLKEDENGDFEKVYSFVRPFKKYSLQPMLLSEPVADALAQLNTFDIAELFDSINNDVFLLNSNERLTQFRSIQSFETKFEWQDKDCYMLANISFEENLAVYDKCCDDNEDVAPCFDPEDPLTELTIAVDFLTDHFHISASNTPADLEGTFITIAYRKVAIGGYIDCSTIGGAETLTGIEMPYADFLANGADFYVSDVADYVYSFFVNVTQLRCDGVSSDAVCSGCIPFDEEIQSAGFDPDTLFVEPVTALVPTGWTVQLFVYCSGVAIPDCDAIPVGSYNAYGPAVTAASFNTTPLEFLKNTCFHWCVMAKYTRSGCDPVYSNRIAGSS